MESILAYLDDHGGRRRAFRGCLRVVRGYWQVSMLHVAYYFVIAAKRAGLQVFFQGTSPVGEVRFSLQESCHLTVQGFSSKCTEAWRFNTVSWPRYLHADE